LDVVLNHMCAPETFYTKMPDHQGCSENFSRYHWFTEPGLLTKRNDSRGDLYFSNKTFPPFKHEDFFSRCGPNTRLDTFGIGPATVYGDFVEGMFDLSSGDHQLRRLLTDLRRYWIAYADIDGFRLDAVKHISEDFI